MVKAVVKDISLLIASQSDCIDKASDLGDHGTESMMKILIKDLEMDYLLLISWLK